jgi:hypothetical protein
LGEVSSRDRDATVVESLQHWKGWNARRESEEEGEYIDPLDAGPGVVHVEKDCVEQLTVKVKEIDIDP